MPLKSKSIKVKLSDYQLELTRENYKAVVSPLAIKFALRNLTLLKSTQSTHKVSMWAERSN